MKRHHILDRGAKALVMLLAVLSFPRCATDNTDTRSLPEGGGEVSLRLQVRLPSAGQRAGGATRSATDDECRINTLDVYHFLHDGSSYKGVAAFPAQGNFSPGPPDWANAAIKTYPGERSRLVIVANARDADNFGYTVNTDMDTFLDNLRITQAGEWYIDGGQFTGLPMITVTDDIDIKKGMDPDLKAADGGPYGLIRMHARIDARLKSDIDNFELQSLCVFQQNNAGYVAFDPAKMDDPAQPTTARSPHVPAGTAVTYEPAMPYHGADTDIDPRGKIAGRQYVFEVDNNDAQRGGDNQKIAAIIIGGDYNRSGRTTYYRVDFDVTDGNILRNHLYDVEIQYVGGPGAEYAEDAYIGASDNRMTATITDWNLADVETQLDGQRILRTNPERIVFDRYGGQMSLVVQTNHPDGFTVTPSDDLSAFITGITPDTHALSGDAVETVEVVLDAKALATNDNAGHLNPSGVAPIYYVTVKAGNLSKKIPVEQSPDDAVLSLQVSANELHFGNSGNLPWHLDNTESNPVPLTITWSPSTAKVVVTPLDPDGIGSMPITQESPYGNVSGPGRAEFNMRAQAFTSNLDPLRERSDIWLIIATHPGDGSVVTRMVSVKQFDYGVAAEPGTYYLNGQTYNLKVRSNARWQIKEIIETRSSSYGGTGTTMLNIQGSDNLKVGTTGGYNTAAGDAVNFTVVNASDDISGTVAVVFEGVGGVFAEQTVTLNLEKNSIAPRFARSNIVWDNTNGRLTFAVTPADHAAIPANVQGVFFKWGSLVAISPVGVAHSNSSILFSPTTTKPSGYTNTPYADETTSPPFNNNVETEDDFATYNNSKGYDASAGKGDICRYISDMGWVDDNWRLPTGAEIGKLLAQKQNAGVYGAVSDPNGFGAVNVGWFLGDGASQSMSMTNPQYGIFVPASGSRDTNGTVGNAGSYGYFWSGSSSYTSGYCLYVDSGDASRLNAVRQNGLPVRCIRDL